MIQRTHTTGWQTSLAWSLYVRSKHLAPKSLYNILLLDKPSRSPGISRLSAFLRFKSQKAAIQAYGHRFLPNSVFVENHGVLTMEQLWPPLPPEPLNMRALGSTPTHILVIAGTGRLDGFEPKLKTLLHKVPGFTSTRGVHVSECTHLTLVILYTSSRLILLATTVRSYPDASSFREYSAVL